MFAPPLQTPSQTSAVDTIPGYAWSASAGGSVDSINQRWRDYLGILDDDRVSDVWQRALHPHDERHFQEFWQTLLVSRQPADVEVRLRRSDGLFRWFVVRAVPLCDERGQIVRWFGQNTDIEDRKRAETTLAGEKYLLEMVALGHALPIILDALCSLVNSIAGGCVCSVLLADRESGVVRSGAAPGMSDALVRGVDGRPIGAPHWGPCAQAMDHNLQVIVADIAADPIWQRRDWSQLCLGAGLQACWTTPIRSRAGAPLGAFAIYQREPGGPTPVQQSLIEQFTHVASIAVERASAEAALKRGEAQLARAQRLSATGSFSYRADIHQLSLSDETYRICGFDPQHTVAPEAVRDRIHPEDLPRVRSLLAGTERQLELECRVRVESGEIRHVQVIADASRDVRGNLVEWVGAIRDLTESKAYEAALSETRSALAQVARIATLGALTASIAHEVNQPLSGVATNTRTLERMLSAEPPNIGDAREAARLARRDAERAVDVIARVRSLFEKTDGIRARFDLNEATRDVLALLTHELERAHASVRIELGENLPHVLGDRVQVQQVMVNLLLNATEAMSARPVPRLVVVRTEHDPASVVRWTVVDSGPGFDAEAYPRLFEMFYTTKPRGLGIGLAVSRSIIEHHRGRLWGERTEPGTAFRFELPCAGAGAVT